MKLPIRLILLQIILGFSILPGQSLTVLREYNTREELFGVIARPDTNAITPQLFLFQNKITDSENGKTLFLLNKEDRLYISATLRMLAIFSPEKQPAASTEPRQFELSVFSAQNKSTFRFQDRYRNQSKIPSFFLNESKRAVLQLSPNGDRLKFYDNHGHFLREKAFSQNLPHNYENGVIKFSGDGNRLAFYTRIYDMESNTMIPMIYLLSSIGEHIWRNRLILKQVNNITIAQSGKFVAVAGTTFRPVGHQPEYHIFVFDSLGAIQNSMPYRAIQIAFDQTENRLLIRDEQTIKIIDLNNEGVQTSINVCEGRQEIADVIFLDDSRISVSFGTIKFQNSRRIYDNPAIHVYSISGTRLANNEFPGSYSYNATLYKSISNHQIGFCLQNKFITLQINQ